jgi:hypothetical protein
MASVFVAVWWQVGGVATPLDPGRHAERYLMHADSGSSRSSLSTDHMTLQSEYTVSTPSEYDLKDLLSAGATVSIGAKDFGESVFASIVKHAHEKGGHVIIRNAADIGQLLRERIAKAGSSAVIFEF